MLVAVYLLQGLRRHAEKTGRLPNLDALLHQPSRGRMPERVGGDVFE